MAIHIYIYIYIYIYMCIYICIYIHIYPIPIHTYRLDDAIIKNHSSFSLACCFLTHSRRNFSSFSKYDPGVPIMQTLLDCLTKADNKKFVHEPRHACHLYYLRFLSHVTSLYFSHLGFAALPSGLHLSSALLRSLQFSLRVLGLALPSGLHPWSR